MPGTTKTFLITLFVITHLQLLAQKRSITGTITDSQTGEALNGVSVRIRGTGSGTFTNQ
jgi:hypothetical protein